MTELLYRPCSMEDQFANASPPEFQRLAEETAWCDLFSNEDWSVILGKSKDPAAIERLKKKSVGWLMCLLRLARQYHEVFEEVAVSAGDLYMKQIEAKPCVELFWIAEMFKDRVPVRVGDKVDWIPEPVRRALEEHHDDEVRAKRRELQGRN